MKMHSFNAYHSYLESMELLSDAERGRLFTALLIYSSTGEQPFLKGNERYVFPHMRCQIGRDRAAYEAKCALNSENGKKGGRGHRAQPDNLKPPEFDEVRAYCAQRRSKVDPRRFFDFYQQGGWRDSRGQAVINWKQKLLTWETYGPESAEPPRQQSSFESIDMNTLKRRFEEIK